jgi:tetratricopeptide (TPR) repeat protein
VSSSGPEKLGRDLRGLVWWVLLVGALLAIVPVQKRIDGERGIYGSVADVLYMPSGRIIGDLSLGNEGLLADIYWTRVVQYFGRKMLDKDVRLDLLGPLLRITTELDPHLLIAYRFGAIFLAAKPPEGAGHPEKAIELLQQGIVANPDYWRMWQDLGFIYYWDLKDYSHAVKAFQAGSRQPGAQVWMKAVAAMVAAKGGDPETSKLLWTQIYRSAGNDQMRENALEHLAALTAHEQIAALNRLIARFRSEHGRPARSIQDLISAGLLRGVPADPSGIPYVVGPDGQAALGPQSRVKLRLLL